MALWGTHTHTWDGHIGNNTILTIKTKTEYFINTFYPWCIDKDNIQFIEKISGFTGWYLLNGF